MTIQDTDEHHETAPAPLRSARVSWLVPLLLTAVLLSLLATSAWFWQRRAAVDDGAAAVNAGQTAATRFFTLSPHDSSSIDRFLASSTGSFRRQYAEQRGPLQEQVSKKQLTVTATVPANGVALEFLSRERAQVLVAVNTTTTMPGGTSTSSAYRTRVVLSYQGGRWLVSGLEQVG